jgi:hypothetical protein
MEPGLLRATLGPRRGSKFNASQPIESVDFEELAYGRAIPGFGRQSQHVEVLAQLLQAMGMRSRLCFETPIIMGLQHIAWVTFEGLCHFA